jgi:hypothetical protein
MSTENGYPPTEAVKAISQIHLEGNITPHTWYRHITTKTGQPHLLAIAILSDVVYWYRARIVRDEDTGHIIGVYRRFRGDKLQRSYTQIANLFGVSKERAKEAVDLLCELGLITREFRDVKTDGTVMRNVMFLEPVPERVAKISAPTLATEPPSTPTTETDEAVPSPTWGWKPGGQIQRLLQRLLHVYRTPILPPPNRYHLSRQGTNTVLPVTPRRASWPPP